MLCSRRSEVLMLFTRFEIVGSLDNSVMGLGLVLSSCLLLVSHDVI